MKLWAAVCRSETTRGNKHSEKLHIFLLLVTRSELAFEDFFSTVIYLFQPVPQPFSQYNNLPISSAATQLVQYTLSQQASTASTHLVQQPISKYAKESASSAAS